MKEKYFIQILYLSLYIIIFCGSKLYILTVIMTLLTIAIYKIINKKKEEKLAIGFFLCVSNIILIIISNILINYIL